MASLQTTRLQVLAESQRSAGGQPANAYDQNLAELEDFLRQLGRLDEDGKPVPGAWWPRDREFREHGRTGLRDRLRRDLAQQGRGPVGAELAAHFGLPLSRGQLFTHEENLAQLEAWLRELGCMDAEGKPLPGAAFPRIHDFHRYDRMGLYGRLRRDLERQGRGPLAEEMAERYGLPVRYGGNPGTRSEQPSGEGRTDEHSDPFRLCAVAPPSS